MSELMGTLKLEIESLKIANETLIQKNKVIYNKNKNLKRCNLRLRKLITSLRPSNNDLIKFNEINTGEWDLMSEVEDPL